MLKVNFDDLKQVSASEWKSVSKRAVAVAGAFRRQRPGYLRILDDVKTIRGIKEYARSVRGQFDDVVVLGIGGSAIGAICLDTALRPLFSDREAVRKGVKWPRLTVLDNIDPALILDFEKTLNLKRTLFLVISKSGGTAETVSQFLYFQKQVARKNAAWQKNFVFVTDGESGWLRGLSGQLVKERRVVKTFAVPADVGGRYSVLSVVGLLPAALVGINIDDLVKGAKIARQRVFRESCENNTAYALAAAQYLLIKKGKSQQVFYVYAHKLRYLADWYRQLLAESIGKEMNRHGKKVNVGITPVNALGVTDQHSQNQLYMDGPDDKIYLIVDVAKPERDAAIPFNKKWSDGAQDYLKGVTFGALLQAEKEGTVQALIKQKRPVITITMDKLTARNLGEIFLLLEASVSLLGELLDINAYDQLGVELSKKLTKEILTRSR